MLEMKSILGNTFAFLSFTDEKLEPQKSIYLLNIRKLNLIGKIINKPLSCKKRYPNPYSEFGGLNEFSSQFNQQYNDCQGTLTVFWKTSLFYCSAVRQGYVIFAEKLMWLRSNCLNLYHPLGKDLFHICYGSFSRICNIHQT